MPFQDHGRIILLPSSIDRKGAVSLTNEKALDDNHEVVALVRSPEKIEIKHEKLKVIKCNIFR